MGRLTLEQEQYDQAERYYKQALDLRKTGDKDAPEMAATFAELGRLYAQEKRYDLARENASRSIAIYQKNLKQLGSGQPKAREIYGKGIAYQSWMLAKLAVQQNDPAEATVRCRTALDLKEFLSASDRDSVASACGQASNAK